MVEFTLRAQRPALVSGYDNEIHVMAKLIAPQVPDKPQKRKSLNLSIVIDRSGSMDGVPLEEAKKCAAMIIESLNEEDRVSIVTYHDHVDIVVPSTRVINKRDILSAIRKISSAGLTALHAGWLAGAEQVAQFKTSNSINRVLLLSDGAANVGLTEIKDISIQCAELAETGVTTSTYGLGRHFNEELMIEMAKSGCGHGYYGETAEDLEDPFREEFELLTNTVATDLEIFIEYPGFIEIELLNSYKGTDPRWKMPDLAYGGEAWALFRLSIKEKNLNDCRKKDILRSSISYIDLNGKKKKTEVQVIRLEPINENAFAALAEDKDIKSRILELKAASLQDKAREAANREDWEQVDLIIRQAHMEAGQNDWVRESLTSLERYARSVCKNPHWHHFLS